MKIKIDDCVQKIADREPKPEMIVVDVSEDGNKVSCRLKKGSNPTLYVFDKPELEPCKAQ